MTAGGTVSNTAILPAITFTFQPSTSALTATASAESNLAVTYSHADAYFAMAQVYRHNQLLLILAELSESVGHTGRSREPRRVTKSGLELWLISNESTTIFQNSR